MAKLDINLKFLEKYRNEGLLLLRVGVGINYILIHGWGKITGGVERWASLGQVMPDFGHDEISIFWGLMAALAESLGALLFVLGYKFRFVSAVLGFTMLVAVYAHLSGGDSWGQAAQALKMVFVFFGMMMIGSGKYALDKN
ncbi:MAG: DoxX family protein [Balneola sp.]